MTRPHANTPARRLRQRPVSQWAAAFAAAALLAVSGCGAQVDTHVTVTGTDTASVTVGATLTGEAAEVVREDADSRAGLAEVFTSRLGERPDIDVTGDEVTATVDVPYDKAVELAGITGVTGLTLREEGTTLEVGLDRPSELIDAITEQAATQPDADVLTQTMLAQTRLRVVVTYPGGVETADATLAAAEVHAEGTEAELTLPINQAEPGSFTVTGDPHGGVPLWMWLSLGSGVAAAAVFLLRRRT